MMLSSAAAGANCPGVGTQLRSKISSWLPTSSQLPPPNQYVPSQYHTPVVGFVVTFTTRWNWVNLPVPVPNVQIASTGWPVGWFQSQTPVVLPFRTTMVGFINPADAPGT